MCPVQTLSIGLWQHSFSELYHCVVGKPAECSKRGCEKNIKPMSILRERSTNPILVSCLLPQMVLIPQSKMPRNVSTAIKTEESSAFLFDHMCISDDDNPIIRKRIIYYWKCLHE